MNNHTATPWQYDTDPSGTRAFVIAPEDETVFEISVSLNTTAHTKLAANLAFAVHAVNRHAKLAALLPLLGEVRASYGRLHDMLSDCIEGGRLTESKLPDDYQALVEQLAACVGLDQRISLAIKDQPTH